MPEKHWTGDVWNENEIPIRENNLDFSFSFNKSDYGHMAGIADEILAVLKRKNTIGMGDVFYVLAAHRLPFCKKAIECVFALTARKSIFEEKSLIIFCPVLDPLKSPDIVVTDVEIRLVRINQAGPLSVPTICEV